MEQLNNRQILIEVSEDKKKVTISSGRCYREITYDACPAKLTNGLENSLNAYIQATNLALYPEWEDEKCSEYCNDCN